MTTLARRATIELHWEGKDISGDVGDFILNATVTDPLSGAVNDLALEMQDRDGQWANEWRPTFGDTAEIRIKDVDAWLTGVDSINFGTFSHDSASFSGPPKRVTIRCVSAALSTGLRRQRKNKAWRGVSLKQMATDIADAAGLELHFNADDTRKYGRREQKEQSDLDFLMGQCNEAGLALKIGDDTVIIFDEHDREQLPPVGTIDLIGGHVLGWSIADGKSDHYGRCRVSCTKARTGKKIEATFRDPADEGPTLEVKRAVETKAEAEAIAKALLRAANRGAKAGELTLHGDPGLFGGAVFDLTNAFSFEGRYIVTKAEHRPTGGYETKIAIRRVLEGY